MEIDLWNKKGASHLDDAEIYTKRPIFSTMLPVVVYERVKMIRKVSPYEAPSQISY